MQPLHEWMTGPAAWEHFIREHPELGYKPGRWAFHNFLRYFRAELVECDAIRLARGRFWVAHRSRFVSSCFDLATGAASPDSAAMSPEEPDLEHIGALGTFDYVDPSVSDEEAADFWRKWNAGGRSVSDEEAAIFGRRLHNYVNDVRQ